MRIVPGFSTPEPPDRYDRDNESSFRREVEQRFGDVLLQTAPSAVTGSPAALASGSTNNYSIGGTVTVLRLTPDAANSTLTGIADGSAGREIRIINIGSANLVLAHNSGSSSAANQITLSTGANATLTQNQEIVLTYDATSQKWRGTPPFTQTNSEWVSMWNALSPLTDPATNVQIGGLFWVANAAGNITAVSARVTTARSTGTLTVELFKNGSVQALTAVIDGTNTTYKATTGSIACVAGDYFDLRYDTAGTFAPTANNLFGSLQVTYS